MGICISRPLAEKTVNATAIDKEIQVEKAARKSHVKLLLLGKDLYFWAPIPPSAIGAQIIHILGPGESGKSTILKQMQILHNGNLPGDDMDKLKSAIYTNIVESMTAILQFMKVENISLDNQELEVASTKILQLVTRSQNDIAIEFGQINVNVSRLWADEGVRRAFDRRTEFQLNDSAQYFFDNVCRVCKSDYSPTQEDALRVRVASIGVTQVRFESGKFNFQIFDVGGQKSERRKWIHIFDDVNAILFIVAISEYDKVLREDGTANRMQDSVTLFNEICNNSYFQQTMFLLFLNKKDLFAEKIIRSSIKTAFPDYQGQQQYAESVAYIKNQFLEQDRSGMEGRVKAYETCATDPTVQTVIGTCEQEVAKKLMESVSIG